MLKYKDSKKFIILIVFDYTDIKVYVFKNQTAQGMNTITPYLDFKEEKKKKKK